LKRKKTWKEFLVGQQLKKTDAAKIKLINECFKAMEKETDIKPEVIE